MSLALPIVSCGCSSSVQTKRTRRLLCACVLQEQARGGCRGSDAPCRGRKHLIFKGFLHGCPSVAPPVESLYKHLVMPTLTHDDPGSQYEPKCALALQRPRREPLLALQECDDLRTEGREVHYRRPSTCASAASVCGSQNVMSIDWYISMAVDNAARACSRWPVAAYSIPRPRWQWAWSGRMPSASARARACW